MKNVRWSRLAATGAALLVLSAAGDDIRGQVLHSTGQNVVPVFEGWEQNPDGTFAMRFGYFNRNTEEVLDIPVGPDNYFEPAPADRLQPSHFYVRRQQFMFKVVVSADWGKKDLVWTLTSNGKTDKAYATLLPIYELSDAVIAENRVGGMGRNAGEPNKRPTMSLAGESRRTVSTREPVTLTVTAADDGFPTTIRERLRRRQAAGGAPASAGTRRTTQVVTPDPEGNLGITWTHYRGPGNVTFDPMKPLLTDGSATTTASFGAPGTYILRAYADDGILTAVVDVSITVNPR
jgi:hypothetical protein